MATYSYSGKSVTFTAPADGIYDIIAYGGAGGGILDAANAGGAGAKIGGDFSLTAGETLVIDVGGEGQSGGYRAGGGGGGGSFVIGPGGTKLVIAGGGGGAGDGIGPNTLSFNGYNANTGTAGGAGGGFNGGGGRGGTGGAGGKVSSLQYQGGGAGGGGFRSNGQANGSVFGGQGYPDGLQGGKSNIFLQNGNGAFGGGGAGGLEGGGGGGGYSGGGGGSFVSTYTVDGNGYGGGGGGSFDSGTNQVAKAGYNTGSGYVVITQLTNFASTIIGTIAKQKGMSGTPISAFSTVSISDANSGTVSETVTVTASSIATNPDGTLSDTANGMFADTAGGIINNGTYTVSGSASTVTADLDALTYTPVVAVGQTVTTTFTISDTNSNGATSTNTTTSVAATAVCYARGTLIMTPTGGVAIEALGVGQLVVTADKRACPIKWIGRRTINLTSHPRPELVAPIRITRGAVAPAIPARDLLLSPDHAVALDGKLVCARQLVNGATIWQETGSQSVEYFHVELEEHAILLAEGLAAESYLATGNRGFFARGGAPIRLHPDLTAPADHLARETASCLPFVWEEADVQPLWQSLAERAVVTGHALPRIETTNDPGLVVIAGDRTLHPVLREGNRYIFVLPQNMPSLRLVSHASAPTETRPWLEDRRCLGVYVSRITVKNERMWHDIPLDSPALTEGWWNVEQESRALRRWTNGSAVCPLPATQLPAATLVEIHASSSDMLYRTSSATTILLAEQQRPAARAGCMLRAS